MTKNDAILAVYNKHQAAERGGVSAVPADRPRRRRRGE